MKYRRIIYILICLVLFGLVVYHLPQTRQLSLPVSTAEGDSAEIEVNVKYYRRLFSRPWIEGTIIFDGVTYCDSKTVLGSRQKTGYWDWQWFWGDSDSSIPANTLLYKEGEIDTLRMNDNCLRILFAGHDNTFNEIGFMYVSEEVPEGICYYGPAQTAEEVEQLRIDWGWSSGK